MQVIVKELLGNSNFFVRSTAFENAFVILHADALCALTLERVLYYSNYYYSLVFLLVKIL